jgi:hypothetical protein
MQSSRNGGPAMVVETRRKSYHQHSIINTVTQEMMIAPRRRLLNQPLTAMRVKVEAVSSSTLLTNFITNVTTALILLHHQNVSLTTTITDRARGGHVPLTIGAGLYLPVDQFTFPMYKLAAHMMNGIKVVSPGAESNGEGVREPTASKLRLRLAAMLCFVSLFYRSSSSSAMRTSIWEVSSSRQASVVLFGQDIYEAHIGEQPEIASRYYHQ